MTNVNEPQPTTGKRLRRRPDVAENEILAAAEKILLEDGPGNLSVSRVMEGTGMKRAGFYNYFRDQSDLIVRLISRVEEEMMEASRPWLTDESGGRDLLDDSLNGAIETYRRYGHVLAAAEAASFTEKRVKQAWRHGIVQSFIDAVGARIASEKEAGRSTVEDPAMTARALVLMNTRILNEVFGGERTGDEESAKATLRSIWADAIYGAAGPG